MKRITIDQRDFQAYMANLCDIFQDLRWHKTRVVRVDIYPQGVRLFDKDSKQVAAFKTETIKKAQEEFNATFRD